MGLEPGEPARAGVAGEVRAGPARAERPPAGSSQVEREVSARAEEAVLPRIRREPRGRPAQLLDARRALERREPRLAPPGPWGAAGPEEWI